ncbi:MAG: hypothetical protein ACC662_08655, partial [Planctomycetota bacterium]
MRIHDVDPVLILPGLEVWEGLPVDGRTAWLLAPEGKSVDRGTYGSAERALVEGDLLEETDSGRWRIPGHARPLRTLLRAADRCRVLTSPSNPERVLREYVQETYGTAEREALLAGQGAGGWSPAGPLARRAASRSWIEELLGAEDVAAWERRHLRSSYGGTLTWAPLLNKAVFAALVRLLDDVREAGGAARLADLFGRGSVRDDRNRSTALQAALRYLVLFPRLDREEGVLDVGLVPSVARALALPPPPEPEVFQVDLSPTPTFWIADMTTVLLDAAGGETRVKADGHEFYASTTKRLLTALEPIPPLVGRWAQTDGMRRLSNAMWALNALQLVRVQARESGRLLLRPTGESRAWLAAPLAEKVRAVADLLRGEDREPNVQLGWAYHHLATRLAPEIPAHARALGGLKDSDILAETRAAIAEIPTEGA